MRNSWYKKVIVFSIIVLFIGVGVYPTVASETNSTIVNNKNKEECGCKEAINPKLVFISNLLERVESYINYILVKYGHIPGIEEKCNEILTNINLRFQAPELICDFLWNIYDSCNSFKEKLSEIANNFEDNPIMIIILESIFYLTGAYALIIEVIGMTLNCEWAEWPW